MKLNSWEAWQDAFPVNDQIVRDGQRATAKELQALFDEGPPIGVPGRWLSFVSTEELLARSYRRAAEVRGISA